MKSLWIQDFYYFEGKNDRFYVVHGNSKVYNENDDLEEAWKCKIAYILPVKNCHKLVKNYLKVLTWQTPFNPKGYTLKLNGKRKGTPKNWYESWILTNFVEPKKITIEEFPSFKWNFDSLVTKNSKIPSISTFLQDLKTATFYDQNKELITEKMKLNLKKPINREYKKFITELPNNFPRRKYERSYDVPNLHLGQRKLLLSEIEFLSLVVTPDTSTLVVYAGAGPGDHNIILSKMFPECYFMLVDPAFEHTKHIKPSSRRVIHSGLFTDVYPKILEKWSKYDHVVFVSDIRSTPPTLMDEEEMEKHVSQNMKMQMDWYISSGAKSTLLKFRLPYREGNTKYLCGDLLIQAYPPTKSTELRLLTESTKMCNYDNKKVEEQMFYFNTIYRNSSFYDIQNFYGHNYDTLREYYILEKYLEFRGVKPSLKNVVNLTHMIDTTTPHKSSITNLLLNKGVNVTHKLFGSVYTDPNTAKKFDLKFYFPPTDYSKLAFNRDTLTYLSTTHQNEEIMKIVCSYLDELNLDPEESTIIDATSSIGGNVISFSKYFQKVIAIEFLEDRYFDLLNNLEVYGISNVEAINGDSTKLLFKVEDYQLLFIDPPWGGDDYMKLENVKLSLGEYKIVNLINDVFIKKSQLKIAIVKLPLNYDIKSLTKLKVPYDIYLLSKMLIVVAYIPKYSVENLDTRIESKFSIAVTDKEMDQIIQGNKTVILPKGSPTKFQYWKNKYIKIYSGYRQAIVKVLDMNVYRDLASLSRDEGYANIVPNAKNFNEARKFLPNIRGNVTALRIKVIYF